MAQLITPSVQFVAMTILAITLAGLVSWSGLWLVRLFKSIL